MQSAPIYVYSSLISSVVGIQANNRSEVESVAASQHNCLSLSIVDSPVSTLVANSFPNASRKMVVVVVILVHVSLVKVKAF